MWLLCTFRFQRDVYVGRGGEQRTSWVLYSILANCYIWVPCNTFFHITAHSCRGLRLLLQSLGDGCISLIASSCFGLVTRGFGGVAKPVVQVVLRGLWRFQHFGLDWWLLAVLSLDLQEIEYRYSVLRIYWCCNVLRSCCNIFGSSKVHEFCRLEIHSPTPV